ncbi:hypothetical protein CRG98_007490 [Punica granatum]|uniref:Uncharacterized protein n=1 Tax=Punica granatum TaxID=22663 RepID=A0A2I0KUT4_PUNGR|nr:hypothetical protein CRG98_007490 [Punica granatum]
MAEDQQPAIHELGTPSMPTHSQTPLTQVISPPILAEISTSHSGVPIGHHPLTAQTASNLVDSARFTALEGMVNQLATNMATNMTELMAMLRDQNRTSSSFTPPPEHRPIVYPNPTVPSTCVSEVEDISFSATTYAPPAAFLSTNLTMHTLPLLTVSMRPPIYTVPPPTIPPVMIAQAPVPIVDQFPFQAPQPQISFSYPAPPPLNIPPTEPGTPTQVAPPAQPTNIPPKTENEQERRIRRMEETIRALQVGNSRFDFGDSDWNLFLSMRLPPKIKIPYFKIYDGEAKTRLLASSILDIKRHSRFRWTTPLHCRLLKHMHIPCIMCSPTSRNLRNSMLLLRLNKVDPRLRDLLSRLNMLQPRELNRVVMLNRVHASSNKIRTEASGPHFDPSVQNQNMCCEFHKGAPGHTLDTCWRLRDKIQEMIDTSQISFNEVKPPNVYANPFPDHGSSSGPSVDMISIAAIGEDAQKTSVPFVINYALVDGAFTSVLFVVEVPAKEPYQDHQVPWNYGGEVANMEQEMSAMGITRLGRVYQGPEPADKGKALATAFSAVPEAVPLPTKKVTDQEAESFMKVIKASEYKVVEQMGKSPAHISLLVLLLSSESHRNALLKVLTATQVLKDTASDRIDETVNSIFSNQISFADDELSSEGQGHLRALHIVCKCNNHVVGRVMIHNVSALNVCPVSTLKQKNVDMSHIRASKTTVRAFDGSRREVNGEMDLLIDKMKFFVEGKLITINGEEDYVVYKETAVPYISIGEHQNLPFHSFDTISVIRDYG